MTKAKLKSTIYMYRLKELGDCFRLKFELGSHEANVVLDCGSFRNGNTSKEHLQHICDHIKDRLPEKGLDVVIATHQHNDHMSGFMHAKEEFEEMAPDQVYLSWLDDPTDTLARDIAEKHKKIDASLARIAAVLKTKRSEFAKDVYANVSDLVDNLSATGSSSLTAQATSFLKTLGKKDIDYLRPGQVLDLPGLPEGAVKMHILGPPRNYKQIKDTRPNKGESYDPHLDRLLLNFDDFLNTLDPKAMKDAHYPFNYKFKKGTQASRAMKKHYKSEAWRTIDEDWLVRGEELALHLNSYTNNTSLVVAFELVESKKFLLFVGDAQTGNWNSWEEIEWEDNDHVDMDTLLSQVVFYKVGHHGSHNATHKNGLDRMTHEDLVAFIPVNKKDPNISERKKPWKMPAKNLYRELISKTKGRVARMDEGKIKHDENNWETGTMRTTKLYLKFVVK